MFAAAVPLYPSFNAEERVYDAVLLSWEDGAVDLKDGTAKVRIKAQVYPITLKDKTITWSSSDEEIAQIDEEGMITASKAGTAEITATLESRSLSATAQLSVRQPVSSVFLPTSTITLYVGGESRLLSAKVFPEDATNQNIKWSSKDTKVARVDSTGRVTPVGAGMTEITATTEDGGFEAKCFVSVVNKTVEVETVSVKNGENMKLTVGESVNAIVSVSPSNAKNKTLTWSSDNEAVAKVSQTGRIRAVGAGTANITVKTQNGKNAVFKVEVAAGDGKDPFDLSETTEETVTEGGVTYTSYNMSFMQAVKTQMLQNPPPKIWKDGSTVYASEIETAQYMNPSNYYTDAYKYQFLDLSKTNNVSEARLNEYLADKGVLRGKGAVFIAAAQKYNVSEVYLVAHACLESGNGTSTLATGVSVNGTTVYNVFGINAYDSAPVSSGSSKAYAEGWTSVDKAIYGGAQWISENYINSTAGKQNTLYKMRWNPENSGSHQYATDISWAVKQAVSIEKIFSSFADASLSFDVPVYSGQVPPTIDTN
jgi:type VI secretion system secreted protein VgrG